MAELKLHKCKLCGEPLDITKAVGGAVQCGYCGTMYTLPKETADDRLLNFLDSGELSLDKGDFEGAITSYSKAAEIDGNEPEANFGKALSKFKVRYIKDEVANRLQPICYEVTDKKFSDDPDYMRAYMKATPEQRAVYEEKAKDIDYIQSEFYNLKQSGLDYDCFICVKVTDDKTHAKTEDSKDADYIYHLLKDKGYKPFYSEYEIRNKQGADYEAHILYALYTSECMLVICSDEEYLQTKWVKNEYSRFLKLVNDEEKDSDGITIVFKGKPIEKLPGKRGKLQGINFEQRSADGQIVEFVDSHTPAARAKRAAEAEEKKRAAEEQKRELAEQRRAIEEQQRQIAEQLDKLKNISAAPSAGLLDDELFERMERAREERERKKREEEKNRHDTGVKLSHALTEVAREKEEAERKRQEKEKSRTWLLPDYPTLTNYNRADFEISGTELKKYTGKGGDVKIPLGVTAIDNEAFKLYRYRIKNVAIPDGVTSIGEKAFYSSLIENVVLGNSIISIGEKAFLSCDKLKSITIPESVTSISESAFGLCNSLESIEVDANNKNYSSQDGILYNKDKTEIIQVPETKTEIKISADVTSVGGEYALPHSKNLKSIEVDAKNKSYSSQDGILYNKDKTELIKVPAAKTEVIIPAGVTSIGNSAFDNCENLTSIAIPYGVTSIGAAAFQFCKNLKSITLFAGLTSIGDYAFYGCEELTNVKIPDSVTSIGEEAFCGCKELTSVVIPNGVTSIGQCTFNSCENLTSVVIPNGVTSIGYHAFYGCTNLKIYCRADKKPENWAADWNLTEDGNIFTKKKAKVIWGYKD